MSRNTFSRRNVPKRKEERNLKFLTKTMDKPLLKNANFATCLNRCFYGQKRLVFVINRHETLFLGEMYQKEKKKKSNLFTKNID